MSRGRPRATLLPVLMFNYVIVKVAAATLLEMEERKRSLASSLQPTAARPVCPVAQGVSDLVLSR